MYLRLDNKQIRYRLMQDELTTLQKNGLLEEDMPFTGVQPPRFAVKIDPNAPPLSMTSNKTHLTLHLPSSLVTELLATKPKKEGMTVTQIDVTGKTFDVTLEIDVRKPNASPIR